MKEMVVFKVGYEYKRLWWCNRTSMWCVLVLVVTSVLLCVLAPIPDKPTKSWPPSSHCHLKSTNSLFLLLTDLWSYDGSVHPLLVYTRLSVWAVLNPCINSSRYHSRCNSHCSQHFFCIIILALPALSSQKVFQSWCCYLPWQLALALPKLLIYCR